MDILIFGSTGRVGKILSEKLLEQGHSITSIVRDKSRLPLQSPNLLIFEGDIYKKDSLKHWERRIMGQ